MAVTLITNSATPSTQYTSAQTHSKVDMAQLTCNKPTTKGNKPAQKHGQITKGTPCTPPSKGSYHNQETLTDAASSINSGAFIAELHGKGISVQYVIIVYLPSNS